MVLKLKVKGLSMTLKPKKETNKLCKNRNFS